MNVVIDDGSGFCFGVRRAIATLEEELSSNNPVYCVGDIVHNEREIERLQNKGLKIIDVENLTTLHDCAVLFRAHGEPPSSYSIVKKNNLRLTDATCPVVLKLQQRIRESWKRLSKIGGQVVLFGKKGHAEVIGLMGQTNNECVLIENESQIYLIDSSKLYALLIVLELPPGKRTNLLFIPVYFFTRFLILFKSSNEQMNFFTEDIFTTPRGNFHLRMICVGEPVTGGWAELDKATIITKEYVQKAFDERVDRIKKYDTKYLDMIKEEALLKQTSHYMAELS